MIYQRLVEIAKERSVAFNVTDPEFSSEVVIKHGPPTPSIQAPTSECSNPTGPAQEGGAKVGVQEMRAYRMWHDQGMSITDMCTALSTKGYGGGPIKRASVMYVLPLHKFSS